jgi:hypothetical protein
MTVAGIMKWLRLVMAVTDRGKPRAPLVGIVDILTEI